MEATEMLYHEHEVIEDALCKFDELQPLIGVDDAKYCAAAIELIGFLRSYADGFHHHKEEELLFPELVHKNELLGEGVIAEMLENHNDFRDAIAAIEKDCNDGNATEAQKKFRKYAEALRDHMAVENDELFPLADALLNKEERETMRFRFEDIDRALGVSKKQELAASVK